ncbi:hypothetical protein C7B77_20765 [Chamaesiphon polymorphus CCALA 037]|uniref:Uncharacterized protein n=1 Tax=Chamaesiphon polymorphus CCALA 037 TaxID=2107692 RepID=A0A2T1G4J7_9CYAN|nr:hypothetical protein C7B77_20765 [Chamaesiphon polymorphus CCALA 037]
MLLSASRSQFILSCDRNLKVGSIGRKIAITLLHIGSATQVLGDVTVTKFTSFWGQGIDRLW